MLNKLLNITKELLKTPIRKIIFLVIVILLILGWKNFFGSKSTAPQYQTAQATKGTLITSVSASGNISTVGNINILTQATGTIKKVYVKNGETVTQGQKIADITLDQNSQQKSSNAYSSYLSAKNSLSSAQTSLYSLDSAMWAANQKFINDAVMRGLATNDPTYIQENDDWQSAQAKYLAQQTSITQAQMAVNNAWLTYQQLTPNITAPAAGTIINLTVAEGLVIASQTTSSTTSTTSQSLGTIITPNITPQAIVNLSEIDVPNVQPGQKVTLILDAFPNSTFTGKVLIINSNGSVSSGVTTYPATINFDTNPAGIYPNMGVNAEIITSVSPDVLTIPSAAIQTTNGQTTVRILKNGQMSSVNVVTGTSNDTDSIITSGLNEGDTVVTSVVLPTTSSTTGTGTTSIFGSLGGSARGGAAAGGAAIRFRGD